MGEGQWYSVKLYTEDINKQYIRTLLEDFGILSYTIFEEIGVANRKTERALVIEVITNDPDVENQILAVAEEVRVYNEQDTVLVVTNKVNVIEVKDKSLV